jgi:hypothetical protein
MKMPQTVSFKLTETQQRKIALAKKEGVSVILRLNIGQKHAGDTPLLLTERELKKLDDGNSHNITLSSSRVKKTGGLLPLLPLLGGVGALTGIVTSIVNAIKNSRSSTATRDAAKATEDLAKFRLASEQKAGSGLKFKRNK